MWRGPPCVQIITPPDEEHSAQFIMIKTERYQRKCVTRLNLRDLCRIDCCGTPQHDWSKVTPNERQT